MSRVDRVVRLPDRGRLIIATDFQGNLEDYLRVEELFEAAAAGPDGAVLVVTGDLVHGPEIPKSAWPSYLGTFYRGDSATLLLRAQQLQERHPGRVFFLLGNHEHAHIGGPVVSKFFPDEARRLEHLLGARRAEEVREWLRSWPLGAIATKAGIVLSHGAPNACIRSAADLEAIAYAAPNGEEDFVDELLVDLLWARTASSERAREFMRVLDGGLQVAVYGHDVAREGFAIDREPLLCLSTSFGCCDGDKMYLDWDLSTPVGSARELAERGLELLYPDAAAVFRVSSLP